MDRKEAIKEVRSFIGQLTEGCQEAIRALVPELAEIEDERIRKELIEAFEVYDVESSWNLIPVKHILAWLEKQKEQKPISSCEIVPYIDDKIAALQDMWREEKVAFDWDDMHEMIEDVARHFYQKEQQHAECISDSIQFDEGFKTGKEVGFREGVESVKPAEWSEEDEEMLQRIIRYTESEYQDWCNDKYGHSEIVSDGMQSCCERIDWLKALSERIKAIRPQPQWKPSEEQMHALFEAHKRMSADYHYPLITLYNQLKKL